MCGTGSGLHNFAVPETSDNNKLTSNCTNTNYSHSY